MAKKRRPLEHIIADLSVNYVERFIFLCGYSVERVEYDYGYDLIIFTYDSNGEIENGQIYLQLKARNSLKIIETQQAIAFQVYRSDLELWLLEPMPCMLIVYDAQMDKAYWLYLQAYFEKITNFNLAQIGETVTVYIPTNNILNQEAVKNFAKYKDNVLQQLKGVINHHV